MRACSVLGLVLLAATACEKEAPLAEADRTARTFLEAFASGDHETALRHSAGDVRRGVEVAKATRDRERQQHPAEVALLEEAMRTRPPDVELTRPRRQDEGVAEVRAVVTTQGPGGPERQPYELLLTFQENRWWVYHWQRR